MQRIPGSLETIISDYNYSFYEFHYYVTQTTTKQEIENRV